MSLNQEIIIAGVLLRKLNQINDQRGGVFHYLNNSSPEFNNFGEIYFSKIVKNVVKGWKCHLNSVQNMCTPFGSLKIVIFDNRPNSKTYKQAMEIILDDSNNYFLLTIPPNIYYSFQSVDSEFTILANLIDIKHKDQISINLPLINDLIQYKWN